LSKQDLLKYYQEMVLIRKFEEKSGQLYGMGLIAGFCHLYIGQEAVVVGVQASLTKNDHIITAYRDHGHILVAGMEPKYVMAELLGKASGCSKGKGGSMHMFDLRNNFWGGHGIVGAQVALGTGIAFACQYRDTKDLCVTYMGDGAVHQGQVFESFNMAAMWKIPVIYIIENNGYSMGTSVERHSCRTDLHKFGESFNIPGIEVNGMDVEEVRKATDKAVEHVRSGKGPIILEMKTYRYRGHSMSDPGNYRDKSEVTEMREHHDPIETLKKKILQKKYATEEELSEIDKEIKVVVNDSAEFAKNSPEPDSSELYTDIYKD
jgi:pyruvate dehydrogenase E1 component alpha subunit